MMDLVSSLDWFYGKVIIVYMEFLMTLFLQYKYD